MSNHWSEPADRLGNATAQAILRRYRSALRSAIDLAEQSTGLGPRDVERAIATILDELNRDLMALYRRVEGGRASASEVCVLIPNLERLRTILRFRNRRRRTAIETLHDASTGLL